MNITLDHARHHPVSPLHLSAMARWRSDADRAVRVREECAPSPVASDTARLITLMVGRRKIRLGEGLYHERDPFQHIYAVQSGSFKSTLELVDGSEQVCHFSMAGEVLGLDGVAEDRHASSATALEDSEISTLSYAHLRELCAASAGVQSSVMRLLGREVVRGQRHFLLLGGLSSTQRLAAFLLNQSQRLKARGYSSTEFHLRMTRGEIGSFLGMTLETVSRTFTELQQQRLLKVERRHIVISNLDGLARV